MDAVKYLRRWDLPAEPFEHIEHFEEVEGYGTNYFWYCHKCRAIYANASLSPEDCSRRSWRGVSGLCLTCEPNRYYPRGSLECAFTIGWKFDLPVILYQLNREIDFLCHPNHPHYKED